MDLVTVEWVKFRSRAALAIDGEFRTRSKINSGFNLRWREIIARKDLLVNFSAIPAPNENNQGDADEGNTGQAPATVRARVGVVSCTTVWCLMTSPARTGWPTTPAEHSRTCTSVRWNGMP